MRVHVETIDERTRDLTIESPLVGNVRVRVLLPSKFQADGTDKWPVLYLLNGGGGTQGYTEDSDVEALTAPTDLLVVMPDAASGWYVDGFNGGAGGPRPGRRSTLPSCANCSNGTGRPMTNAPWRASRRTALALWTGPRATQGSSRPPPPTAPALKGVQLYLSYGNGQPGPLDGADATVDGMEVWISGQNDAFVARLKELGIPATVDAYGPGTHSMPYWERGLHESLPMLLQALGEDPSVVASPAASSAASKAAP